MHKVAEGVWREDKGRLLHLARKDHRFLLSQAGRTEKKKARICAHQEGDALQEMLICQGPNSTIEMHSHQSPESCVLISGRMVVEFADGRRILMERGDYLRIPAGVEHRPRPLESCLLLEYILL